MVMAIPGLIERDDQIHALAELVAQSSQSGSVALVSGEAGFGKTTLIRVFTQTLDHRYHVLIGACEPLGIPAPFAPLLDFVDEVPGGLLDAIRSGAARPTVYAEMLDMLKNDNVILVIEDAHWADEATLGLIRYLGKRIEATNSSLLVTYRSEDVDTTHPLRLVIADLGRAAARIDLPALSPSGVAKMTSGLGLDPVAVHRTTLGNPFFVEEVIRHPDQKLPPTVENAVLASAAQLPEGALALLYMVALSPDGLDPRPLLQSNPEAGNHLDLAVQRRLLTPSGGRVECRHDLIRESLLQAIPPVLKLTLHRRLLELAETDALSLDVTKLAYHSVGARDAEKAASYSLQAAREAARSGAHRQAAFHYSNALEFRAVLDSATRDRALLEASKEHSLINDFATAVELSGQRLEPSQSPLDQASARAWFAFFQSRQNDLPACRREAELALEGLRSAAPSEELALSLAVLAWVESIEGNANRAVTLADEAVALAQAVGASQVEVDAATTAGAERCRLGDADGLRQVQAAADLGVDLGLGESAARALNHVGLLAFIRGDLEEARAGFERLIEYTTANELDAWYIAGVGMRAWINLASGRWDEADQDLELVLGQRTCVQTEVETLVTAAMLRVRRGDPGGTDIIEDALARVRGSSDQSLTLIACALAMEGAWVGVYPLSDAVARYEDLLASPAVAGDRWSRGILGYWARRLDLDPPQGNIPGPAGLEWSGAMADAAESWAGKGFVVEAAVTGAMGPAADLASIFTQLGRLGAHGVARGLRGELQRRGAKHIPRGERAETRDNPAGLTPRQAEVLSLMASGLSNADIAEELFISEKTASHHVSAVLAKLHVSSRLRAAAIATANGWADRKDRVPN